jgi:hypothetical protein
LKSELDSSKHDLERIREENRRILMRAEEEERKRSEWLKEFENWRRQVEGIESK